MKYRVEVGSFVTRLVKRTLTVNASSEFEAQERAIEFYRKKEQALSTSVDSGTPTVDSIEARK